MLSTIGTADRIITVLVTVVLAFGVWVWVRAWVRRGLDKQLLWYIGVALASNQLVGYNTYDNGHTWRGRLQVRISRVDYPGGWSKHWVGDAVDALGRLARMPVGDEPGRSFKDFFPDEEWQSGEAGWTPRAGWF